MHEKLNYNECYDILGLKNSNQSWEAIRLAYRKQSQKWHPDKASQNKTDASLAEEKFKLINLAYKQLQQYYDKFGTLPDTSPVQSADYSQSYANVATNVVDDTAQYRSAFVFSAIVILVLLGALIGLIMSFDMEDDVEQIASLEPASPRETSPVNTPVTVKKPTSQTIKPVAKKVFSFGSTMGEVIEAQGRPDVIDSTTWWYGESMVVFEDGVVKEWKIDEATPLNVTIRPDPGYQLAMQDDSKSDKLITVGLTKKEVLEIQGKPVHSSNEIWEYGLSKVYFRNGRVISWYSSPLEPLKVRN